LVLDDVNKDEMTSRDPYNYSLSATQLVRTRTKHNMASLVDERLDKKKKR